MKDWRTLPVTQWEPTRYWVGSQTRGEVWHLVDTDPWQCSCEHSTDFSKAGKPRECAHQRRVKLVIAEKIALSRLGKKSPASRNQQSGV